MSGIDIKKAPAASYDLAIGNSITNATAGSILFAGAAGILAQDNANLFFDDTNNYLGIGINSSLLARLHVKGSGATSATSSAIFTNSAGTAVVTIKDDLSLNVSDGFAFNSVRTTTNIADSPKFKFSGNNVTMQEFYAEQGEIRFTKGVRVGVSTTLNSSIESLVINGGCLSFANQTGSLANPSITTGNGFVGGMYFINGGTGLSSQIVWTNNGIETIRFNGSNSTIFNGTARLKGYTVATLPAGVVGDTAYVTNALGPVFLAPVVGGGAVITKVFYDGANWVVG